MADHAAVLPKLDTTLGAAFLGNIFSAIFYGITTLQMFTYFMRAARRDALFLRSLVRPNRISTYYIVVDTNLALFADHAPLVLSLSSIVNLPQLHAEERIRVLDTLHLALVTHGLYFYLISNFMNARAIASPTWYALPSSTLSSSPLYVLITHPCRSMLVCNCARRSLYWVLNDLSLTRRRFTLQYATFHLPLFDSEMLLCQCVSDLLVRALV